MASLTYHDLDINTDEIRLLTLHPGRAGDKLCLSLTHASLRAIPDTRKTPKRVSLKEVRETLPQPWEVAETLDGRYLFIVVGGKNTWSHPTPGFNQDLIKPDEDPPSPQLKYEALSYTWGSMEKAVSARVIDETTDRTQTIALGANLADALEHLRLETESRTLWVDAICINQADIEERNAQVKRMGSIYTLAERVVIWLGPETSDSNLALSTMQYLADQVENTLDRYNCDTPDAAEPLWFNRAQALLYNKQTWAALLAFFQRPGSVDCG